FMSLPSPCTCCLHTNLSSYTALFSNTLSNFLCSLNVAPTALTAVPNAASSDCTACNIDVGVLPSPVDREGGSCSTTLPWCQTTEVFIWSRNIPIDSSKYTRYNDTDQY